MHEEFGPAHPNYKGPKFTSVHPDGGNFTQPAPINHNELKRLLVEVLEDIVTECYPNPFNIEGREALTRRVTGRIERAILDGDDS